MADINPVGSTLPTIREQVHTSVTFEPVLQANETLVSLNIIDSKPNSGISVDHATFSGVYRDSFQIDANSIIVRMRSDGLIKGFSSWDSLPPPLDADIIEWRAPQVLKETYWYDVELKYTVVPDPPIIPPPPPEERTLVKRYTQIVIGDWSTWAQQLRSYVKASGSYPT